MPDDEQKRPAPWMYSGGSWTRLDFDPIPENGGISYEESRKAAGYELWFGSGKVYHTPLAFEVYARFHPHPEPRFVFDLDGPIHGHTFYAADLPDALALTQQLAPVLQALTITDQIANADPESLSVLGDLLDKMHGRSRGKNGKTVPQ